jgi:hypothetical protein
MERVRVRCAGVWRRVAGLSVLSPGILLHDRGRRARDSKASASVQYSESCTLASTAQRIVYSPELALPPDMYAHNLDCAAPAPLLRLRACNYYT